MRRKCVGKKRRLPHWQPPSIGLSLALTRSEGGNGARFLIGNLNLSILALIAHDILLQCGQETLGMLGSQDDTALDGGLGHAGQHPRKVEDKVARRVGDDGKVGILSLRHLGRQLYLQSLLLLFLFVHCCIVFNEFEVQK